MMAQRIYKLQPEWKNGISEAAEFLNVKINLSKKTNENMQPKWISEMVRTMHHVVILCISVNKCILVFQLTFNACHCLHFSIGSQRKYCDPGNFRWLFNFAVFAVASEPQK